MQKIINKINGMMFIVPDNHPIQPEWGRKQEMLPLGQLDLEEFLNSLDDRDRARVLPDGEPGWVLLAAEYTSEPYSEPITREQYDAELEKLFLSVAKLWDYISIDRLIGYATSNRQQWKADALAFIEWRDSCVDKSYEILYKVQNNLMQQPSIAEFIAMMPTAPEQPKVVS